MKLLAALLVLGAVSCSSPAPKASAHPEAQRIVDHVVSQHPDIVRLTIHAVPHGESRSRIVASNVAAKLGAWSDPEDARAMATKEPVTLEEGGNLDYTAPVIDGSGKAIAAVGVTVKGTNKTDMLTSAMMIAGEMSASILEAHEPLW